MVSDGYYTNWGNHFGNIKSQRSIPETNIKLYANCNQENKK